MNMTREMFSGALIAFGTIALVTISALAQTAPAQDAASGKPSDIVWCHDTSRSIAVRKARWRCEGEVVTEDQVKAAIHSRIETHGLDSVKQILAAAGAAKFSDLDPSIYGKVLAKLKAA